MFNDGFDGDDAVILSGETYVGKYHIQAVQVRDEIARCALIIMYQSMTLKKNQ